MIGQTFAEEFINWLNCLGYAPGITTTKAVNFLKVNGAKKWKLSGANDSKGCGTVIYLLDIITSKSCLKQSETSRIWKIFSFIITIFLKSPKILKV